MKLLLDTHVLLWWSLGEPMLGSSARSAIADDDNEILYSAASPWELAIKIGLRRLNYNVAEGVTSFERAGFRQLPISLPDLNVLIGLERLHGDPFDRMIVSQALVQGATIMTVDAAIARYPVRTIGCD